MCMHGMTPTPPDAGQRSAVEHIESCINAAGSHSFLCAHMRDSLKCDCGLWDIRDQARLELSTLRGRLQRAEAVAALATEYAQCMQQLRDEDGDLYGWSDHHSGESIVGMTVADTKDWLARYEDVAASAAAREPKP